MGLILRVLFSGTYKILWLYLFIGCDTFVTLFGNFVTVSQFNNFHNFTSCVLFKIRRWGLYSEKWVGKDQTQRANHNQSSRPHPRSILTVRISMTHPTQNFKFHKKISILENYTFLLRVVQIQTILFLKSMSERGGPDIQRLWNWMMNF